MSKAVSKKENRWALRWAVIIVALTCLPYLVAWLLAPPDTQYTGLLINPLDGETYYAKMQHGAQGNWLFHLTFTPEDHQGVFVYTFLPSAGQDRRPDRDSHTIRLSSCALCGWLVAAAGCVSLHRPFFRARSDSPRRVPAPGILCWPGLAAGPFGHSLLPISG